jgi:hypothetical protein
MLLISYQDITMGTNDRTDVVESECTSTVGPNICTHDHWTNISSETRIMASLFNDIWHEDTFGISNKM